jgi:hypothetical protein
MGVFDHLFGFPNSSLSTSGISYQLAQPANKYNYASFIVYWMVNWVGMIALGLACENVAMFIGQPWTALWLIFWVITNVSTAFYSITMAPHFYYFGYAWPLHNGKRHPYMNSLAENSFLDEIKH